jgi:hypothetical protein
MLGGGETREVGPGLGVVGLDCEGALVGGAGGFDLAAAGEKCAQIVPAVGVLRIELEGLLEFSKGFF